MFTGIYLRSNRYRDTIGNSKILLVAPTLTFGLDHLAALET